MEDGIHHETKWDPVSLSFELHRGVYLVVSMLVSIIIFFGAFEMA